MSNTQIKLPDWVTIHDVDGRRVHTRADTFVTLQLRSRNKKAVREFMDGLMDSMPNPHVSHATFWFSACSDAMACVEIIVHAGKFDDMRAAAKLAIEPCTTRLGDYRL